MYDSLFCRLYNEFGWNEYPRVFAQRLWQWLTRRGISVKTALDLGCGTGVLCETLNEYGVQTTGVDLSENMIAIARDRAPGLRYEVADMTAYRPARRFDLVTCTGDAINHVPTIEAVARVFANAFDALEPGGLLVFDLLRPEEVPVQEPFEAEFDGGLRVCFSAEMDDSGNTTLHIDGYAGDTPKFTETIREKVYDVHMVLDLLKRIGFEVVQCADRLLLDGDNPGTTWFIIAKKPA